MTDSSPSVHYVEVDADQAGQRVDNFLIAYLKGVPKSYIYRILRKGEIRVNKGRVKAQQKLKAGDSIRIPPVRVSTIEPKPRPRQQLIELILNNTLYEDDGLLVVNKPAGLAVHGGSGINLGVIEVLRFAFPDAKHMELVHRLDKDTSGCLIVAKRRSALLDLQAQWRQGQIQKRYWALVDGAWPKHCRVVEAPLLKNQLASGERMVRVHQDGKASRTEVRIIERLPGATLIEASPITGRTHQIRVHCQFTGHSILGDEKYCDNDTNKNMRALGLKQLCLHARDIQFRLPGSEQTCLVEASLDKDFAHLLENLRSQDAHSQSQSENHRH